MNTSATRRHWAVQHREASRTRQVVAMLVSHRGPPAPLARSRVTVTRWSSREPDHENMALGAKAYIDGLVACGVLEDDSPRHVERAYDWAYAPRGQGRLEIVVEEIA